MEAAAAGRQGIASNGGQDGCGPGTGGSSRVPRPKFFRVLHGLLQKSSLGCHFSSCGLLL